MHLYNLEKKEHLKKYLMYSVGELLGKKSKLDAYLFIDRIEIETHSLLTIVKIAFMIIIIIKLSERHQFVTIFRIERIYSVSNYARD